MEYTESTAAKMTTGEDDNQETDETVIKSSKPLHRFLQNQPRSFGIVILIFGCTEVVMGFVLAGDSEDSSLKIYVPFWQGALFLTCGVLSIYTDLHPSKKKVTVSLAMYVVSLLGILVSIITRIVLFIKYSHPYWGYREDSHQAQVSCVEGLLFVSSVCVSALLIFLAIIARFALRSRQSQIIVQHIVMQPQTEATSH